jgi:hypothetical protein
MELLFLFSITIFYANRISRVQEIRVFVFPSWERKGGERVKKEVLFIAVALVVLALLATPVLAIGPFQGAEANDNDNLRLLGLAVNNLRGDGNPLGFNSWIHLTSGNWLEWKVRDARYAKGIMNNAIVPTMSQINPAFMGGEANQNTWMYLTPNSGTTHGTLWVFIWGSLGMNAQSAALADGLAQQFPGGAFYMYNIVVAR